MTPAAPKGDSDGYVRRSGRVTSIRISEEERKRLAVLAGRVAELAEGPRDRRWGWTSWKARPPSVGALLLWCAWRVEAQLAAGKAGKRKKGGGG